MGLAMVNIVSRKSVEQIYRKTSLASSYTGQLSITETKHLAEMENNPFQHSRRTWWFLQFFTKSVTFGIEPKQETIRINGTKTPDQDEHNLRKNGFWILEIVTDEKMMIWQDI